MINSSNYRDLVTNQKQKYDFRTCNDRYQAQEKRGI